MRKSYGMVKNGLAVALVAAMTTAGVSGQQQAATPAAGAVQAQTVDRYIVGRATPPTEAGTQVMDLTLDAAMAMALEKNLDLKAQRINPQLVDYNLAAARAAYNPQLTGSYRYNNAQSPNNNNLEGATNVTQVGQNFNTGMTQQTRWYGGSLNLSFTNGRTATNSTQTQRNPSFSSGFSASYTQPLLAGFKIDNTRNQLRTLAITRQISDLTLLAAVENTKASVRTAYWNLRSAIETIEIQRRALDLARRLFEDNRIKVEIGTLAPIDTVQPETAVANAEVAVLNAQITWRTAELNLKRLLAASPDDEIYRNTINPTEQASLRESSVDIAGAVKRALADRTDIVTSQRNIESAQLTLQVTENQTKPNLSLQGGYSLTGQGGPRISQGVIVTPGGYGDAVGQVFGFDLPTWNLQFNFTYPLFMAAAKANYARAVLSIEQQKIQLDGTRLTISADVTNAGLAVENTYKQFQASVKAREAAERNAEAEQTRFDVGMSTNYNVVQAQNNLTSQRLSELQRLIQYLNAIAEFDRIQRVGR